MENWSQTLSKDGYRITEPRKAVMAVLMASGVPLSAQEILERGQAKHATLGLVTVYRTLELFEELGLACRVHLPEGCHGFLGTSPGHHHQLVCRRCGRTVEFRGQDDLDEIIAQLEARTGYEIGEHLLQLLGLCPECQEADAEHGISTEALLE